MRTSVSACLAVLLACVSAPPQAAAHPGSLAMWKVDVEPTTVRSEIVVSLLDFGWTPEALESPENDGALGDDRRLAIARELLAQFTVVEDAGALPGHVVEAHALPASGSFTVNATHPRVDARKRLALRSSFHVLTDETHRVIARVEHEGVSPPIVLTAATPEYVITDGAPPAWRQTLAPPGSFRAFLLLGVEHILTGYDHLVFLLCLLVPGGTWRSMLAIVTAFTVAHSITLVLAALQFIVPPPRFVEAAIAVSIAYVALANLLHRTPRARWPSAFGFGLIHGFGFAGMLNVLEMPTRTVAASVLAFNLGVEAGQLAVVALAIPLIALVAHRPWHRRVVQSTSVAVCLMAAYWMVERLQ